MSEKKEKRLELHVKGNGCTPAELVLKGKIIKPKIDE